MMFGEITLGEAEGAILAHGIAVDGANFKKGRVLSPDDLAILQAAGIASVIAARLEPGDIGEDEAAAQIAHALNGENLSVSAAYTGRVNLFASSRGLAVYDRAALDRLNNVHEAITVATLPPHAPVEARQMVATVKIIPFAVPGDIVAACVTRIETAFRVAPYAAGKVGLIQTQLPGTREKVLVKTVDVLRHRIEGVAGTLAGERRCGHNTDEVADAIRHWRGQGCDMILLSGASAITDRRDVIPSAIEAAGGIIDHFGMPVDPGNLMLIGHYGETPVLGLPGCARSPKVNGFDWVLQRFAAGLSVSSQDVMDMGAGGLLTEISSRPLPRAEACAPAPVQAPSRPRVAAVILAAGQSRRMGPSNKLLADVAGKAMVVHVADAVQSSQARPVLAVVGHQADAVRAALAGHDIMFIDNPDFAEGISGSLKHGLRALPRGIDGAIICLGDMPRVTAAQIDRLVAAFNPVEGRAICVPTFNGKRGNPVLFARRFFEEMESVSGDVGARHLIGEAPELVCEVEMEDRGVLLDIDTPEALAEIED
ncbi:MAG: molybdopterin-binding/glycosyltransferase family 2 protein [Proteobacteria bacterium]|nr:molybdopterin-binding/glycosyltransferase family 2 protein [Pseudomonadota bacterium]